MKCITHEIDYCPICNIRPPLTPFSASFEGYVSTDDDWPNTVSVEAVTGYDPSNEAAVEGDDKYADSHGDRKLVEIDTNYKPTRPGQHPVRLTRTDAVHLAGAVLQATEDTFHYSRCGQLRAVEAVELLRALQDVEYQLTELREHALADLLDGTGLTTETTADPDPAQEKETAEPGPANELIASIPAAEEPLTGAIVTLFPTVAEAIKDSAAFGALSVKVNRRCQETGETPLQVLSSLDSTTRAFVLNADDPAAFLAARIES